MHTYILEIVVGEKPLPKHSPWIDSRGRERQFHSDSQEVFVKKLCIFRYSSPNRVCHHREYVISHIFFSPSPLSFFLYVQVSCDQSKFPRSRHQQSWIQNTDQRICLINSQQLPFLQYKKKRKKEASLFSGSLLWDTYFVLLYSILYMAFPQGSSPWKYIGCGLNTRRLSNKKTHTKVSFRNMQRERERERERGFHFMAVQKSLGCEA